VDTKSDRWVTSGYSGFLPEEDFTNAIIGAMINIFKVYVFVL